MKLTELLENINKPNWDWPKDDFSWLSSESGLFREEPDGCSSSIFFIHGGRIREQSRVPYGYHKVDEFVSMVTRLASGLDEPRVVWSQDTGGGDCGFWVEGTRLPNESDVARLAIARERKLAQDARELIEIEKRRNLFTMSNSDGR